MYYYDAHLRLYGSESFDGSLIIKVNPHWSVISQNNWNELRSPMLIQMSVKSLKKHTKTMYDLVTFNLILCLTSNRWWPFVAIIYCLYSA